MRPHVEPGAGAEFRRTEMIEEDERADHALACRGQGAPHREAAEINAARNDRELDRVGARRIAERRIIGREEAHVATIMHAPWGRQPIGVQGSLVSIYGKGR